MADNNYPFNYNQGRLPDSNLPHYQGSRNAQNVNYGSNYHFVFGRPGSYNVSFERFEGVRHTPTLSQHQSSQTQSPGFYSNVPNGPGFQNPSTNFPGSAFGSYNNPQPGLCASIPNQMSGSGNPMAGGFYQQQLYQHQLNPQPYGQNQQFYALGNSVSPSSYSIHVQNPPQIPQNNENSNLVRSCSSSSSGSSLSGGGVEFGGFSPIPNQPTGSRRGFALPLSTVDFDDDDTISSQESFQSRRSVANNAGRFDGQNGPQYPQHPGLYKQ